MKILREIDQVICFQPDKLRKVPRNYISPFVTWKTTFRFFPSWLVKHLWGLRSIGKTSQSQHKWPSRFEAINFYYAFEGEWVKVISSGFLTKSNPDLTPLSPRISSSCSQSLQSYQTRQRGNIRAGSWSVNATSTDTGNRFQPGGGTWLLSAARAAANSLSVPYIYLYVYKYTFFAI